MPSNLIIKDKGWNKILREARKTSGGKNSVLVGIRGRGSGKKDLATIGLYHEKGGKRQGWTRGCPPKRSFIAPAIDSNKSYYLRLLDKIHDRVLRGLSGKSQGLFALGSVIEMQIKNRITAGIAPELAKSTKRQKKAKYGGYKNTPLIRTRRLYNSITHWLK